MREHRLALTLLLLCAVIWGATFVVVKEGLSSISPEVLLVWRFALGSVALVAPGLLLKQIDKKTIRAGAALGIFLFLGFWLQTRGLLTTTPLRSAFLTALTVIFVPFFDWVVYRVRAGLLAMLASALALAGTIVMVGGFEATLSIGDFLTLLGALSFALYVVLAARLSRDSGAIGLAAVQLLTVALLSLPLALSVPTGPMDKAGLIAIAVTALLATSTAFFFLMWAQARTSALEAVIILSLQPVVAAATSALVGTEAVTASAMVGGTMILAATIVCQIKRPVSEQASVGREKELHNPD